MKRYIILLFATIIAVTAIFTTGSVINAAVEANYYQLKKSSEDNTVTSSGKLQYLKEEKIKSTNYQLIDKIFVSEGDAVNIGTPLYSAYEIENSDKMTYSFPESEKLVSLISKADISEEILEELKKYALKRTIKAAGAGTVSSISFQENSIINKDSVVMKIADTKEKCIRININETYISQIKEKQRVNIKFAAADSKIYTGTVKSIAKEAKQTSTLTGKETTVEVVVKPDINDDELRIGYSAECNIITSTDKDVLVLPYEYIYTDENGDYVFLYMNDKACKKYVKCGKEYRNGVSVVSGLKENDKVLMPDDAVLDGQKVVLRSEGNNA